MIPFLLGPGPEPIRSVAPVFVDETTQTANAADGNVTSYITSPAVKSLSATRIRFRTLLPLGSVTSTALVETFIRLGGKDSKYPTESRFMYLSFRPWLFVLLAHLQHDL
jgi:hypothetical protein